MNFQKWELFSDSPGAPSGLLSYTNYNDSDNDMDLILKIAFKK